MAPMVEGEWLEMSTPENRHIKGTSFLKASYYICVDIPNWLCLSSFSIIVFIIQW